MADGVRDGAVLSGPWSGQDRASGMLVSDRRPKRGGFLWWSRGWRAELPLTEGAKHGEVCSLWWRAEGFIERLGPLGNGRPGRGDTRLSYLRDLGLSCVIVHCYRGGVPYDGCQDRTPSLKASLKQVRILVCAALFTGIDPPSENHCRREGSGDQTGPRHRFPGFLSPSPTRTWFGRISEVITTQLI